MQRGIVASSWVIVALGATMVPAVVAIAQDCAYTVTANGQVWSAAHGVRVITQQVAVLATTVSCALGDQPVHPHLIEVQVVNTTIWLDLKKDYIRQGHYKIDENHFIPAAQRLARSLRAGHAYTIWGSQRQVQERSKTIHPHMILMKPKFRHLPQPRQAPPVVPGSERSPKLVVLMN